MNKQRIGVILGQVGTPEQPTPSMVKAYLKRFLSDVRVIDYPRWLWQPLLRCIILQTRPKKSAAMYRQIWREEGSPLMLYSLRQQQGLQERLGSQFQVELGLAYTAVDAAQAVAKLEEAGIERILLMPLFPQYSSTTTASFFEAAALAALGYDKRYAKGQKRAAAAKRFVPELQYGSSYYDHPAYIEAMRRHLSAHIATLSQKPDFYLLTFHGIPERYVRTGDPYVEQCTKTAELLAAAMGWEPESWQISYQSRFGPEKWVQLSTSDVLEGLAKRGISHPLVFAPGFVTDCLETLFELGIEGKEQFVHGGGLAAGYQFAPCLNDDAHWLDFMAQYVHTHIALPE